MTGMQHQPEEMYAQAIREVAKELYSAEVEVAKTEADLKRTYAKAMLKAELEGNKTAAAQSRSADEDQGVYDARVAHGVAKGKLAAAKAELKAAEVAFDTWRTQMATLRLERKAYAA